MLLNRLIRTAAVTGRADAFDTRRMNAFFGGRQGARWAEQTVAAAIPAAAPRAAQPPPADPAGALRELTNLHEHGVVTDAEFASLRAQLQV
jgi:hypothetical protein